MIMELETSSSTDPNLHTVKRRLSPSFLGVSTDAYAVLFLSLESVRRHTLLANLVDLRDIKQGMHFVMTLRLHFYKPISVYIYADALECSGQLDNSGT